MSNLVNRNLRQDITYWPPSDGTTDDFGHPIHTAGVLLKGRWEDKVQQIRRPNGDEVVSMSEVYVNQEVDIAGYLAKGDFEGVTDVDTSAKEIQQVLTIPDMRNIMTQYRAFL